MGEEKESEMATWWDGLQISTFGAFFSVCVCVRCARFLLFSLFCKFLHFFYLYFCFLFFSCFCFKFLHLINIITFFCFIFSWQSQPSCLCLPSSEIESNSYINRKPFKNQSFVFYKKELEKLNQSPSFPNPNVLWAILLSRAKKKLARFVFWFRI